MNIPPDAQAGSSWSVDLDDDNHVLRMRGQIWSEAGDFEWSNYTLEVKVKFLTLQGGGHINFRMSGPVGRYMLGLWVGGIRLVKEHPSTTFYDLNATGSFFKIRTWYTFRVVCAGNSFEVYIDDKPVLKYADETDPILCGRIGLESDPGSELFFDDVKVSTTTQLYLTDLIKVAQDEVDEAKRLGADTGEAEQRLAESRAAFARGDFSLAESLAKDAIEQAQCAPIGALSTKDLLGYSAEYDRHIVEVSGAMRDIRYDQGAYRFVVDDGTGVVTVTFNGTLGEIRSEDEVRVRGRFDASTKTVAAESVEKKEAPTEILYTFLVFKEDFEDADFSDWGTNIDTGIEGSAWEVEKEDDNHVLSGEGHCWSEAGDTEWTDYIFALKVKIVKGMVHINFRMTQKPMAPDRYILNISPNGLILSKGGTYLKEQRLTELKKIGLEIRENRWYAVDIVCVESDIKVYLNDTLRLEYRDESDPILSGRIGLEPVPYDGKKPSHLRFDDVKVSMIAAESDIKGLVAYAQTEISKAREINADVTLAELKLEQANQALAREDYRMVQYLVDEAVWLAKRANLGEISIGKLLSMASKCGGHTLTVKGLVKNFEARLGGGYKFVLEDGTGSTTITHQGEMVDIGNEYQVRVTGIFDASSGSVAASMIDKISGPPVTSPSGFMGISWDIEKVTTLISIGGAAAGIGGWMAKTRRESKRRKILFKKMMDDIDDVYSRFKMNAHRCESELIKLKDQALKDFKEGRIDEENYNVLDERIDAYMKEVREQIDRYRFGSPDKLREELQRLTEIGGITEENFEALRALVDRADLKESDKVEFRKLLEKWKREYLKD